jgi:hypothetical protein
MALASAASADASSRNLPTQSCPALSAAPLVYVLVVSPFGARTWAEQQLEMIRLGGGEGAREDMTAQTSYILLALHVRSAVAYALEMSEAPGEEPPRRQGTGAWSPPALAEGRVAGAFEAMGLSPEDLVEPPEMPAAAVAVADAISGLYDWGVRQALELRSRVRRPEEGVDVTTLRLDPEKRYQRPLNIRYMKPLPGPDKKPTAMVFAKNVVRSAYKIALGVAIGILIWGFVRNTT